MLRVTAPSLKAQDTVGKFFYVHVPAISQWQWHPMSVSSSDAAQGTVTFGIKAIGT